MEDCDCQWKLLAQELGETLKATRAYMQDETDKALKAGTYKLGITIPDMPLWVWGRIHAGITKFEAMESMDE